jgi:hypothetical protein
MPSPPNGTTLLLSNSPSAAVFLRQIYLPLPQYQYLIYLLSRSHLFLPLIYLSRSDISLSSSRGGDGQPRRRRAEMGSTGMGSCCWFFDVLDTFMRLIVIFERLWDGFLWDVNGLWIFWSKICCESCHLWDVHEFYLIVRSVIENEFFMILIENGRRK